MTLRSQAAVNQMRREGDDPQGGGYPAALRPAHGVFSLRRQRRGWMWRRSARRQRRAGSARWHASVDFGGVRAGPLGHKLLPAAGSPGMRWPLRAALACGAGVLRRRAVAAADMPAPGALCGLVSRSREYSGDARYGMGVLAAEGRRLIPPAGQSVRTVRQSCGRTYPALPSRPLAAACVWVTSWRLRRRRAPRRTDLVTEARPRQARGGPVLLWASSAHRLLHRRRVRVDACE